MNMGNGKRHDMNAVSGYYQGIDGVFYDFKHDSIFELQFYGREIYRRDVGIVGKMYKHVQSLTDHRRKTDNTGMVGMDNVIYLGQV